MWPTSTGSVPNIMEQKFRLLLTAWVESLQWYEEEGVERGTRGRVGGKRTDLETFKGDKAGEGSESGIEKKTRKGRQLENLISFSAST